MGKDGIRRSARVGLVVLGGALAAAGADGPLTFRDGVDLALRQSPVLAVSEMEIGLQRLDEADSRADYFPRFSLLTRYYVDQPEGSDRRYYLEFRVDPYNPVEAHLSLKAQRLLTRIATLSHVQAVAECLQRLGETFLELDILARMESLDNDLVAAAEKRTAQLSYRYRTGSVSEPEWRAAEQEAEIFRLQREQHRALRSAQRETLGALLGLSDAALPDTDARDAAEQVWGKDRPGAAGWESVRTNSVELQIREIREQLQVLNITAARAAYIPDLLVGVRTPDPLSGLSDEDFYFSVGVEIPIWDGWKRARNVRRQRQVLEQQLEGNVLGDLEFRMRWRAAENAGRLAELEWRAARAREDLADTRRRQAELAAGAEAEGDDEAMAARLAWLQAGRESLRQALARDKALLDLDFITGNLLNRYCHTGIENP
jgi:outer membrane protein TolC